MGRHGTIAGRKEAQDKKRAASFTKLVRLITVAARGGENPEFNVALKHAIEKAKAINMTTLIEQSRKEQELTVQQPLKH